ncbi:hypothetical protein [Eggerthella lenta]|uniref:hypothetical protein n=1 Tax=Eggerthella lenta TaxID=84112 RepID=UPI0022E412F5|nr:hypothetical protein [Eggerthella lenta]
MKVDKGKMSEWTASGIVGGIALAIVMGIVSFVTGSITVVAPFVSEHPGESAACAGTVFFLGVLTGLVVKGRIDSKERTESEGFQTQGQTREKHLSKAAKRAPARVGTDDCMRPTRGRAEPSSDALADLLPLEREMISRLYNEVQVYVGMDGLAAARSLRERGVVARTDAPESGIISQCYVQLTDEWRGIVKAAMADGDRCFEVQKCIGNS